MNDAQTPTQPRVAQMGEINGIPQVDITGGDVTVQIRDDKRVVWVNVNGVCALRICRIDALHIDLP